MQFTRLLLLLFLDSQLLLILHLAQPFDLLFRLEVLKLEFDDLCLLVVPDLDEVGQVLPPFEDVGGILDLGWLFMLQFFNELIHFPLLDDDELVLVLFEVIDDFFDLVVPLALELLDLLLALLADDLYLNSALTTFSFSLMAMVSLRWTSSSPLSCSILFFTLSAPLKSYFWMHRVS